MCKKFTLLLGLALALCLGAQATAALPAGWSNQDVGSPTPGEADESGGVWTVTGNGNDIWGNSDNFHFVYVPFPGNGYIQARVTSNGTGSNAWAKGGVMFREDLTGGSQHFNSVVTGGNGNGGSVQWRPTTGAASSNSDTSVNVTPPRWVRVERKGNEFRGYFSTDGVTWRNQGGTVTIDMNAEIYAGLCVTSHAAGELRTFEFDNVSWELSKIASNPTPADGGLNTTGTFVQLKWNAGPTAVSHDVYISDDLASVEAGAPSAFGQNTTNKWLLAGYPGYPYSDGLVPGTTYYWRVDEVEADGTTHVGDVWSFLVPPKTAYDPSPVDGQALVPLDVELTWTQGFKALLNQVVFGTDFDTVANADVGSGELAPGSFEPPALQPGTTYYWRVDTTDETMQQHQGDVWSFTTLPEDAGLGEIVMERWEGISGTVVSALRNDMRFPGEPDVTEKITSFLWNGADLDNYGARIYGWLYVPVTGDYTFRIATDDSSELLLSNNEDPEGAEVIASISEWANVNQFGKFGSQTSSPVTLEGGKRYYIEALWKEGGGGDHCHVQWSGPAIGDFTTISGDFLAPFEPVKAYGASPADGAPGAPQRPLLSWLPGKHAASHQLWLGTDPDAVANATTGSPEYKGTVALGVDEYQSAELQWGTTYYWRVDEVNNLNADSPWKGAVWSFTTADYLIIDDIEDYNNFSPDTVWESWVDGFGNPNNGSQIGYDLGLTVDEGENYVELGNVHTGSQSMPYFYNNTGVASEATMTLDPTMRDWTRNGLKALKLWYNGFPGVLGDFVQNGGQYTMTAAGRDIWAIGGVEEDEFHFAYKMLNGPGLIQARIVSMTQPNTWTKGGLMIRETLDPNSTNAFNLIAYNSNRARLQVRPEPAGTTASAGEVTGLDPLAPRWLRLERTFSGEFLASHANDVGGVPDEWTQFTSSTVNMASNIYIGMALTSHALNTTATAVFDNVTTSGGVSGAWQHQDIGIQSNAPEQMYFKLTDGAGNSATVANPDPDAAQVTSWTALGEYGQGIALSEFTAANPSLNLANIASMTIGFGPPSGGSGLMFFDDIEVHPARCVPELAKPANDFSSNCVVDMPDLEILTDNWLNTPAQMTETVWDGTFSSADVGTVDPAGTFSIDGADSFTIAGAGGDIWGSADGFQFASQALSGDGQITVRINTIENTDPWAKAGVMIRDTMDPNSAHAMMVITPANGATMQYRPAQGEASSSFQTTGLEAPICLSITRVGDTFTGYYSTPEGWVQQGSVDIPMADPVRIGIAITSHSDGTLSTATGDRNCPDLFLQTDINVDGVTDFKDYATLIDTWLDEQLWP